MGYEDRMPWLEFLCMRSDTNFGIFPVFQLFPEFNFVKTLHAPTLPLFLSFYLSFIRGYAYNPGFLNHVIGQIQKKEVLTTGFV